jgi:hypothetical protein
MKRNIYKLLSGAKQGLFALALTVFSGTAHSQVTYTLNYTGSIQTVTLQPGTYDVKMWGADGGNSGNTRAGIGGYSNGTLTLPSTTTVYIGVGGTPIYTGVTGLQPGGYNGGGSGYANGTGRAGGGATHIATLTGVLSALASSTPAVIMVAGGGGGDQNSGLIGHGGGLSGGGTYPGTQTGSAGGIFGSFGQGGDITVSYGGGGGGGWYGGGGDQNNSGSGGSSYVGGTGITNGVTTMSGTIGFATNPVGASPSNGRVIITQLCSITLTASGSNSLNPSICSGQSLTLTTNGISNYAWSTGNTTNSTIVVAPTITTVYTLSATSPSNCTASQNMTVIVNAAAPVLTYTAAPGSTVCSGQTATLTAGGAVSYTLAGGPGSLINGQTFTPTATSNYTITAQNGCGTASVVTTITVAPLPVTAVASSTLVCAGTAATLTAANANTYTWMPGANTSTNFIVNPTAGVLYTVTGTSGPCTGSTTILVTTKPNPTLAISVTSSVVCEGNTANLTVAGNATAYVWNPGNQTGTSISVNPTQTTLYSVVGTNTGNCTASASQILLVTSAPLINASASDAVVCPGGASTLTATGGNTYQWSSNAGSSASSLTVVNPLTNDSYTVVGTNTAGCSSSTVVSVSVFEPTVTVSSNTTICAGKTAALSAGGADSFVWSTGQSFAVITVTPSSNTVYTVTGTASQNGLSCTGTNTISVSINPNPTVTATSSRTAMCIGETSIINSNGATSYTWNTPSGPSSAVNLTVSPVIDQTYVLTGMDANGCVGKSTFQMKVTACVGLSQYAADAIHLSVYPNPSSGEFTISSDQAISLQITNELGQLIRSISISNTEKDVKINNLSTGVYFITGQNANGSVKQKMIITK